MSNQKKNPRRIPCSAADVARAKRDAVDEATKFCFAICFSVLGDKFGWSHGRLAEFYKRCNYSAEQITEGYVSLPELVKYVKNEYGIDLTTDGVALRRVK